jgi:dienelactone hydrolase
MAVRAGTGGVAVAGRAGAGGSAAPAQTSPIAGAAGAAGRAATAAAIGGSSGTATATSGRPAVDPTQEAGEQPGGGFIREADPTEDSIRKNGEFTVKSYTETDGLVGGTAYGDAANLGDGSQLYYPEGATPPFASMAIVPGFTAQRSDVAQWGPLLASHGIAALVLDTNTVGDTPDIRALALLDAIESLKKENMREGSPVKGKLDTSRIGLMGWSMGGGGTWLSADAHPELKVAVSLCGWTLDFVGSTTKVPSLQLAAELDELAAGMSQPVYAAIPDTTPKMLVEWAGEGHWINNDPTSRANQVGRYGLPWIKVFLEGDERYRKFFSVMPEGASDFQTNQ